MNDDQPISYLLRVHPRSRRIRLTINREGALTVTVPKWIHPSSIEQFILQKTVWIRAKMKQMKDASKILPLSGSVREYQQMKASALALVCDRMEVLNRHYGFPVNRITIRNQKSRWGSCSSRGNLNFSYRVALLPPHLADYIIVHELCHLREHNHSPRFWDLVAQTIPDYRAYRKQLRTGITHGT